MNGIHKFSAQVIDYAERLSDVADAAQGKNHRQAGSAKRWLLLPASGAALYAIVKSDSFSRQAKDVMDDAKTRAAELPEELIGLVRRRRTARSARTEVRSLDRPRPRGRSQLRGGGAPRVSRPLPSDKSPRRQQASPWGRGLSLMRRLSSACGGAVRASGSKRSADAGGPIRSAA
jgi:hypothetical protein